MILIARAALCSAGALAVLALTGCQTWDPVYQRCITEKRTYCERIFACVELGTLVGISVSWENESECETEETRKCEEVSSSNACPGGTSESYSAARHDACIEDQQTQSCSTFASRPNSCETYCSTTQTDGGS